MDKVIAFPQMGNYYVPATYLFSKILNCEIMSPKKITKKTIELGTKNSPDFVCTPFKYTLGTMIESLEDGANVVVQFGGGCRYGYYSELQEQILKDLGYKFKYVNLISAGKTDIKKIYKEVKLLNPSLKIFKSLYHLLIARLMVKYMDSVDDFIRHNIGFEINNGDFEKLNKSMLTEFSDATGLFHLRKTYIKYLKKMRDVKVSKPTTPLKVGSFYIIGTETSNI